MRKANNELFFFHVQYVGFFDETAKQIENKNRILARKHEIFHGQFQILENPMNGCRERGRVAVVFENR